MSEVGYLLHAGSGTDQEMEGSGLPRHVPFLSQTSSYNNGLATAWLGGLRYQSHKKFAQPHNIFFSYAAQGFIFFTYKEYCGHEVEANRACKQCN